MKSMVSLIIETIQDPAKGILIVCLAALVVAGMSVYGMTQAVKRKGR